MLQKVKTISVATPSASIAMHHTSVATHRDARKRTHEADEDKMTQ